MFKTITYAMYVQNSIFLSLYSNRMVSSAINGNLTSGN